MGPTGDCPTCGGEGSILIDRDGEGRAAYTGCPECGAQRGLAEELFDLPEGSEGHGEPSEGIPDGGHGLPF